MFLYIGIGLLLVIINLFLHKKSKYFLITSVILFCILLLLSIFRDLSVGTDYRGYYMVFKTIGSHTFLDPVTQEILWKGERGWYYMNKLIYVYGNFFAYILCFYFITYFLIFKTIHDKSIIPLFSILLYYLGCYYFVSYNVMRQAIGFSFFIYAIRFIEERKFLKYTLVLIVGSFFHLSAIYLIPLYFIKYITWSKALIILLLILSLLLGYINMFSKIAPFIHIHRLQNYLLLEHKTISFFGYLMFSINTILAIIFLIYAKAINSKDSIYLKLTLIGVILSNFVIHYQVLNRFSEIYLSPLMIIGYVNVIPKCELLFNKLFLTFLLLTYALFLFYITLTKNSNGIVPYHIWN